MTSNEEQPPLPQGIAEQYQQQMQPATLLQYGAPWRNPMDNYTDNTLAKILTKLGSIERRLSCIEEKLR